MAPGAAARMAARIFAKSPWASFAHPAMYSSTPLLLRLVTVAFLRCCDIFFIVVACCDFTGQLTRCSGKVRKPSLWAGHFLGLLRSFEPAQIASWFKRMGWKFIARTDRITSAQGKRMPDRPQASNRDRRLVMLRSSRIRGLKFSN